MGQEQPLLSGLWHPYHTDGPHHQTMPSLRTGNLSAHLSCCHRFNKERGQCTTGTRTQLPGQFQGLVAGFLEPGETLEECVHREVMEETGIRIKNLRYFGSQPWPYPSGIMVGYYAEYESGTIKLQDEELSAGAFYHRDHLPEIPKKLSIARKLIDAWLNNEI